MNSDVYLGEWKNDKMDGWGIYIYSNGEVYRGQFVGGNRQGKGEYLYE